MVGFKQSRHDLLEGCQVLVSLAIRQDQVLDLKTGESGGDQLKIERGNDRVGHYHYPLAFDSRCQHISTLQQACSYLDGIAAFTQFNLQPFHGRPLVYIPISLTI